MPGSLAELARAAFERGLGTGLAAGVPVALAAAVLAAAARLAARQGRGGSPGRAWPPLPLGGLLMAAAALAALSRAGRLPGAPAPALGLAALAALALAALAGGLLAAGFDRRWRDLALGPPLLALAAAGAWLAVPDTERVLVTLGAFLPPALLGWPLRLARLGGFGALTATATLAWVAAADGAGRPGSLAGALACLGVLACEPLARALTPGRRSPLEALRRGTPGEPLLALGALAAQLALVLAAARAAARPEGVPAALALALALLALATAAGALLARRAPQPARRG